MTYVFTRVQKKHRSVVSKKLRRIAAVVLAVILVPMLYPAAMLISLLHGVPAHSIFGGR